MPKKIMILTISIFMVISSVVLAKADTRNYEAHVESVAVGFYGHIGVQLEGFNTPMILLNDNHHQDKIYDLLLAAKDTGEIVNVHTDDGIMFLDTYTVILEAALGDYRIWGKSN